MSDSPLLIADEFGIVAERQRDRDRFARFAYKAPVILGPAPPKVDIIITPAMAARIEQRKQAMVEAMIEIEARKLANAELSAWKEKPLPSVAMLLQTASDITGLSNELIQGPSRLRANVYPRHFAIWLIRKHRPDLSLPKIGKVFSRDHTTVMHALKNVIRFAELEPFKTWLADERTQAILSASK